MTNVLERLANVESILQEIHKDNLEIRAENETLKRILSKMYAHIVYGQRQLRNKNRDSAKRNNAHQVGHRKDSKRRGHKERI